MTDATKSRILAAAEGLFADRGLRNTRTRDICEQAEANVAAVNYHFGGKDGLYRACIINSLADADSMTARIAEGATPKERLELFVRALLGDIFSDGSPTKLSQFMMHEMADPSAAFDLIIDKMLRPRFGLLQEIVRDLVGVDAPEEQLQRIGFSIVGQCTFYHHCRPSMDAMLGEQNMDDETITGLVAHIRDFSLGAIAALRKGETCGS